MSEGLNRVTLLGNLGADPELRAAGQTSVLKLRLATTESYFDKKSNERKEQTDWHSVVLFGARAEALARILHKGSKILIEGKLKTSSYEKDGQKVYKTEVLANQVILCGGNGQADGPKEQPRQPRQTNPERHPSPPQYDDQYPTSDDDIPF
jgi:single-strand DNA-binding protein